MSTSISLNFLTQFINDTFDGTKEKLNSFISNCDSAYNLASENQKPIIFSYIKSKVIGKAELITNTRELDSWPIYKTFLQENFSDKKLFPQLLLELQQCRQRFKETVLEYTQRFDVCYSNLIRAANSGISDSKIIIGRQTMLKEIALQAFISGIYSQYHLILSARNPSSYEEASEYALSEEKRINFNNINSGKINDNRIHHVQTNINKPVCYNCNKIGHIRKDCRQRNFNDNFRDNNCNYNRYRQMNNYQKPNNNYYNGNRNFNNNKFNNSGNYMQNRYTNSSQQNSFMNQNKFNQINNNKVDVQRQVKNSGNDLNSEMTVDRRNIQVLKADC